MSYLSMIDFSQFDLDAPLAQIDNQRLTRLV